MQNTQSILSGLGISSILSGLVEVHGFLWTYPYARYIVNLYVNLFGTTQSHHLSC